MKKQVLKKIMVLLFLVALMSVSSGCNMVKPKREIMHRPPFDTKVKIKVWMARSEDCKLGLMIGPAISF